MNKYDSIKKSIPWLIPAILALAAPFIFDLYKSTIDKQTIVWAKNYSVIDKERVCKNPKEYTTRIVLRNESKKNASIRLVIDGDVTAVKSKPVHSIKIVKISEKSAELIIENVISREDIHLLICGEKFSGPDVVNIISNGHSFASGFHNSSVRPRHSSSILDLLKILGPLIFLYLFSVFMFTLGQANAPQTKVKEDDEIEPQA